MSLLNSVELTNMSDNKTGSIDIIMGCMFSGKSTELIRLANRYKVLEMKVLIVNHKLDNRYSEDQENTNLPTAIYEGLLLRLLFEKINLL